MTDNVTPLPVYDHDGFKSFCDGQGIKYTEVTDAFGRPDLRFDRENAEKLWALKLLVDDYTARGGK